MHLVCYLPAKAVDLGHYVGELEGYARNAWEMCGVRAPSVLPATVQASSSSASGRSSAGAGSAAGAGGDDDLPDVEIVEWDTGSRTVPETPLSIAETVRIHKLLREYLGAD